MNWIPKLIVALGLYFLTSSFFMTLGIMILMVVAEQVIEYLYEKYQLKN